MTRKVLIVGAGKMGSALGHVLTHDSQNEVSYWDVDPEKCDDNLPLATKVTDAQVIFLCITSWHIADAVQAIKDDVSSEAILCALTKGIETTTKEWIPDYLEKHFASDKILMLCGPMLSDELNNDLPTKAVLAGDHKAYDTVSPLFEKTPLFVVHEKSARSVAMAGVLKNIYAMGLGIADALALGADYKGLVVSSAIQEMYALIEILGGDPHVARGFAVLGDLVATGHSPY